MALRRRPAHRAHGRRHCLGDRCGRGHYLAVDPEERDKARAFLIGLQPRQAGGVLFPKAIGGGNALAWKTARPEHAVEIVDEGLVDGLCVRVLVHECAFNGGIGKFETVRCPSGNIRFVQAIWCHGQVMRQD